MSFSIPNHLPDPIPIQIESFVGAGERNVSDTRSSVQTGRIDCLLLHSVAGHVDHVLLDSASVGPATPEFGRKSAAIKRRMGQRMVGTSADKW